MKLIFFLPAVLAAFSSQALAGQSGDTPFAVVELFSSEGCSSCPAADLLVSKLTAWARNNNKPVYPLIFHVDYWNNLGWRDLFSSPAFTKRQYDYSRIFKDQGVYTPQIIVNGSDAFVGSDQKHLQDDLDRELSMPSNLNLDASLARAGHGLTVNYMCKGFSDGDVLNIALVERGLTTDVTAGENSGRRLHHDNVVREFLVTPLKKESSKVSVSLEKIADPSQASVIVYVQNSQTMLIEAAKQLDVETASHE